MKNAIVTYLILALFLLPPLHASTGTYFFFLLLLNFDLIYLQIASAKSLKKCETAFRDPAKIIMGEKKWVISFIFLACIWY